METEFSERSASIDILIEFDLKKILDASYADELEPRERAQVREYVQNIFRRRSYLDFLIDHYSSIGVDEMKAELKNILRLGIYDLLFMDSTPDYAAINEAVEIAKAMLGSKTGDLVNAIMRNLQRDIENLQSLPTKTVRNWLLLLSLTLSGWLPVGVSVSVSVKRFS